MTPVLHLSIFISAVSSVFSSFFRKAHVSLLYIITGRTTVLYNYYNRDLLKMHIRPLLRTHILNINMRIYVSGCVRANAYNLILIFASYYHRYCTVRYNIYGIIMLPGPGPGPVLCIYDS